jgi:nitrite reductase/ring-hydroxylating ferredoxin subunit
MNPSRENPIIPPILIDDEALEAARRELNGEGPETSLRPFVYACELSEIPADGLRGKSVACDGDEVALFRLRGRVFAISNICPHEMSPLLAAGLVDREACTVACPLHGWTYEIETGRQVAGSGGVPLVESCAGVATYEVRLIGDEVWVESEP